MSGGRERGERRPDGTRAARLAEDRGDLAVGDDLAPRDATDEAVDQPAETGGSGGAPISPGLAPDTLE